MAEEARLMARYHVILVCTHGDVYVLNRRTLRAACEYVVETGAVMDAFNNPDVKHALAVLGQRFGDPVGWRIVETEDGHPPRPGRVVAGGCGRWNYPANSRQCPARVG